MLARRGLLTSLITAVLLFPSIAGASLIITASHADDPLNAGASLDDIRLEVSLSVTGSQATMTFENASVAPELSAVFKTIVIDTKDDDTDQLVLWNPLVRDDLSDGVYNVGPYNVLPGFNPMIVDGVSMIELNAANPAPHNGLSPGDRLVVQFDTSLAEGAGIDDYLALFDGGSDTVAYCLGFHAISTDTVVDDGSASGAVPEPTSVALLAMGLPLFLLRRRRRRGRDAAG